MHGVIQALPCQAAHRAVHGKPCLLLPCADGAGRGGTVATVHRDGGDVAVIRRQPPQVKLHGAHAPAAAALPHRAGKLPGGGVGGNKVIGDRQADLLEFVPRCAPHDAVGIQPELRLERLHGAGGGGTELSVHLHRGQRGVVVCRQPQPELQQPDLLPGSTLLQHPPRPCGAAEVALQLHPGAVQRLPRHAPHGTVLGQGVGTLKAAHGALGCGSKMPVHAGVGQCAVILGKPAEPELHLLHMAACGAAPQHRTRPRPGRLRPFDGFAFAGKFG